MGRSSLDWDHLFALKKRWGVSVAAIVRRAHGLELVSPAQYKVAFIHIRSMGWHRKEPNEPEPEHSRTLDKCIALLMQVHGSFEAVAHALRWEPELLTQITGSDLPNGKPILLGPRAIEK
jgi:Zn-dependent peptidase ImmA (M78 family)